MSAGAGEASATLWVQGGQVHLQAPEELLRLEDGVGSPSCGSCSQLLGNITAPKSHRASSPSRYRACG